jgi:excisionase family DNA binding protein
MLLTYPVVYRLIALVSLLFLSTFPVASSCAAAEAVSYREVLDLDEAAALLRVRPKVVRKLAEAHGIPARRVGDTWRFSRAALVEWLRNDRFSGATRAVPAPPSNVDRVEALSDELSVLSARGVAPDASTRLAQAAPHTEPQLNSPSPPTTVGERPALPTAEEIALRDQRALLKRGAVTVDFGVSYSYSEQTLFPVIRQEQHTVVANAALRYGLLNDLQATVRVPGVWRRTTTFSDATISGTTSPRATRDDYLGDASVSLLGVARREAVGWPNVIWSVDGVVPTGPGDRGLGAGLVLSKSYDPAVIFAGLSYLHGLSVEPANSRRSLARDNIGLSLGYTYALNDSLALNTVFVGTYRNAHSPDGVSVPPPRERYQLQLGMTWLLARGLFMEPAVAMRFGGDSPDLTVSLNIPYSF